MGPPEREVQNENENHQVNLQGQVHEHGDGGVPNAQPAQTDIKKGLCKLSHKIAILQLLHGYLYNVISK